VLLPSLRSLALRLAAMAPKARGGLTAAALAASASDSERTVGGVSGTDTETESVASSRSADRNRKKKERKRATKKSLAEQRAALIGGSFGGAGSRAGESSDGGGASSAGEGGSDDDVDAASDAMDSVQIEYVSQQPLEELLASEGLKEFASAFARFSTPEELTGSRAPEASEEGKGKVDEAAAPEEDEDADGEDGSKKLKKKLKRLTIAELKQLVNKPEVVEPWDVTAMDPRLLVLLKSTRNTIPVPRHWSQKRKFLQGKRGIEKPPFQLPEFIAATGESPLSDPWLGRRIHFQQTYYTRGPQIHTAHPPVVPYVRPCSRDTQPSEHDRDAGERDLASTATRAADTTPQTAVAQLRGSPFQTTTI